MKYVRMGSTGTQVSRLCLGCMSFGGMADWTLNEEDSLPIVKKAAEAGINFFDTADIYSRGQSEEILGRALKALAIRRDETVVATKVFNPMGRGPNRGGLSRKHIMQSIDESLKRLGMDYVDLYQIHRFDYQTPIEETIEALDDVVKAGKAIHVLAGSRDAGTTRSKSAMGGGRYNRPADQSVLDTLKAVAKARGESQAQVAIAWLLSKPAVTAPIIGATKLAHLDDPIRAVESALSEDEIAALEAPYVAQAVIGAMKATDFPPREIRARSAVQLAA